MAGEAKLDPKHAPGTSNVQQLSQVLDCSTRTVEKYAEQGLVVRVGRGRYHFLTSIKNVVAHLRKQASLQVSNDGKMDQISENVLSKQAQRRYTEIRIQQLEKTLISMDEVEETWSALVMTNRQLIMSIPGRCRLELPHLTGHDQKVIQELCHALLSETALGDGKMPPIKGPKVDA